MRNISPVVKDDDIEKKKHTHSVSDISDFPEIPDETAISEMGFTKNGGDYSKPDGGIPKSDLAADVRASLAKADTALQSHQSLGSYVKTTDSRLTDARPANGGNADTVNGHTVNADVPADAKFTDTTYSAASSSDAGLMIPDDKTKLDNLAKVALSGSYNDLTNKPQIPSAYTHPNSGVTAGTYRSVTVNAQGHVTGGTNPTTLAGYGITDAAAKSHTHTKSQISDLNTKLSSEDLNNIKTVGFYYGGGSNNVTNKPAGVDAFGLGVLQSASGWWTQILYASNMVQKSYRRWFDGSSWTTWQEEKITDTWRGIQNNLTSDSTSESLSAAQGKVLKGLIDTTALNAVKSVNAIAPVNGNLALTQSRIPSDGVAYQMPYYVQSGTMTVGKSALEGIDITFPRAFTAAPLVIFGTAVNPSYAKYPAIASYNNLTNKGFTLIAARLGSSGISVIPDAAPCVVNWVALGQLEV